MMETFLSLAVCVASLVRSAFMSVVTDKKYFESKRMKEIRELADSISSQMMIDEKMEIFDEFAKSLYRILEVVISCKPLVSSHDRQLLWGKYHKIRNSSLLELWMNLFKSLDVEDIDVMLIQIINDTIFNELVTFHTTVTVHSMKPCKKHLSPLEENIICYASGYIPRKEI